jgi:hypothetical protein
MACPAFHHAVSIIDSYSSRSMIPYICSFSPDCFAAFVMPLRAVAGGGNPAARPVWIRKKQGADEFEKEESYY